MTIRVSRIFTIDGTPYEVSIESGSMAGAISLLAGLADEAGAAPEPAATKTPGRRGRRSKAEMEAAKASAAEAGMQQPSQPLAQIFPVSNGGPVEFAAGPSQDFDAHHVGLAPAVEPLPPVPIADPAIDLRNAIGCEFDAIAARVPAAWKDSLAGAFNAIVSKQGAAFNALGADSLRTVFADLQHYGQRCDESMRGGPR